MPLRGPVRLHGPRRARRRENSGPSGSAQGDKMQRARGDFGRRKLCKPFASTTWLHMGHCTGYVNLPNHVAKIKSQTRTCKNETFAGAQRYADFDHFTFVFFLSLGLLFCVPRQVGRGSSAEPLQPMSLSGLTAYTSSRFGMSSYVRQEAGITSE